MFYVSYKTSNIRQGGAVQQSEGAGEQSDGAGERDKSRGEKTKGKHRLSGWDPKWVEKIEFEVTGLTGTR